MVSWPFSQMSNTYSRLHTTDKGGLARKMELIDRDRLLRLQRGAKAGNILHTKRGVFETTPCGVCGFHHKLALSMKKQAPCPATDVGMRYYAKHPREKLLMENFPLNKVLKLAIRTIPNDETSSPPKHRKLSSKSVPKINKSEDYTQSAAYHVRRRTCPCIRPKTARGRNPKKRESRADQAKEFTVDDMTWKDVFDNSQISSSEASSDIDSTQDSDSLRRHLIREMFTQEEEALRYRLAKEKERYHNDMKLVVHLSPNMYSKCIVESISSLLLEL